MKIKVNIVQGFLGSGKTRFINSIIKDTAFENEKIIVLQAEEGKSELSLEDNVKLIKINKIDLTENDILGIIEMYSPDRIFIELNGMRENKDILNIFNSKTLSKVININDIITLIDSKKFDTYYKNIRQLVFEQIFYSKTIIINTYNNDNLVEKDIKRKIKAINEVADIYVQNYIKNQNNYVEGDFKNIGRSIYSTIVKCILIGLFVGIFYIYRNDNILEVFAVRTNNYNFQSFYIKFISIVIEGIPFIIIGSLLSGIIQVTFNRENLEKFLPKNTFMACIMAALSGIVLPICDCGTIPIVRSFIKKGVPISVAVTFMLSAPIVNPISIMATVYAFPGHSNIMIERVIFAIIISIVSGLVVQAITLKNEIIFKNDDDILECDCGFCETAVTTTERVNNLSKIISIFNHSIDEFFKVGKFIIIGAFLSSVIQNIISVSNISTINIDNRLTLLIMMIFGFLLSVCSTSDAFIAKGFLSYFSVSSIMGFLVFGPMIDIKNTIMLFGNFKKSFVFKVILVVVVVSFGILAIRSYF